jgi:hypothetical protein
MSDLDERMAQAGVLMQGKVTLKLSEAPSSAPFYIIKSLHRKILTRFPVESVYVYSEEVVIQR